MSFSQMKADIHPHYVDCIIRCACGATYHTRSTRSSIDIGICSACHPFFTGEQKFVDTAGRVEKFSRRYGATRLAGTATPKPPKPLKSGKPTKAVKAPKIKS